MRVLALVTDLSPGGGGIARYNTHFLSALTSLLGENSVVVLPRKGATPETLQSKLTYVWSILQTVWKQGPFHLIFCGHLNFVPLAAALSRIARVPFWLQIYGFESWRKPSFLSRWAVEQAKMITAISRYTRRRFLAWANIPPEKVRVLPCTIDESFKPGPKPDWLLERYGLKGKKILFTLSRLSSKEQYKGHDRVISLVPELLRKHPSLVYVIAGDGDDRSRLELIAREEHLNGAVRFIGAVQEHELVDHYRMADLFVMPSTGEGFGIAFLEAASCGTPVIGGKGDGSFDALLEGSAGSVVDADNTADLFESIQSALRLGKNDMGEIEKGVLRFSQVNFGRWVENLIKGLVPDTGDLSRM